MARIEAEQDNWFLWLPVAFAIGIAAYFNAKVEPSLLAVAALVTIAVLIRARARQRLGSILTASVLLAMALGVGGARLRTEVVKAPVLERQIGPVEIKGWVELVEPRPGRGQRLTIWPTAIETLPADRLPVRIRVRTQDAVPGLGPGQAVRLRAMIGPPAGPAFPGDFDFARLAYFQQLGGIGIAVGRVAMLEDVTAPPTRLVWRARIERIRQAIGARITAVLPGETGAIANALITGERGAISEATNQVYRDSGLFHILSISGLHMVIMAGAVFFVVRLLLAAFPRIALRHPIKKWAAAAAIAAAITYLVISGSAFATVRSAVMITIMFLAVMLDRPALALRNVALAALLILGVYPESLFDAGFQMSFAAVIALLSAYAAVRRYRERHDDHESFGGPVRRAFAFLGEIMLTTVIAGFAVAPFGIYHFHNTQLLAFVANIAAIPVCNLVVMPAALATLVLMPFGLEAPALHVMGLGIDGMSSAARYVASLPGAVVRVPAIPTGAFIAMIAGGLWLLLWSTSWRILGLIPIIAGAAAAPMMPRPDILISRDARMVAIRQADGTLSSVGDRSPMFDLGRWLEAEADARKPHDVAAGDAFACDPEGCTARVKGLRVAVARSPAALRLDCTRTDILIAGFPIARACPRDPSSPTLVIDHATVAAAGSHTIMIGDDRRISVTTAADHRGVRPWSRGAPPATPAPGGPLGLAALGRWLVDVPPETDRDDSSLRSESD